MTSIGILQILVFFGLILLRHEAGRAVHGAAVPGRAHLPASGAPAARGARSTSCAASARTRNSAGRNTRRRCWRSASSRSCSRTRCSGCRVCCRSIRRDSAPRRSSPDLAFNTAISFMTNTNWQSYSGESTMSYFVQMAALAVQNFVSAAAGIAIAIALIRGFARQETDDDRQLLGRCDARARSTSCCRSRSSRRCCSVLAGRHSELQSVHRRRRRSKARRRPSRRARSPRRKPSSSSAPTAAASSTPTRRIRSRTRRRSRTCVQMFLIFVIGAGLTYTFGKMVGDTRQGWALFCGDGRDVPDRRLRRVSGRAGGQSDPGEAGRRDARRPPRSRAATWKARRRASASPARRCSRRSRPTRAAAPSTACTTASRRSAGWCRCSTCRPAK